MDQRGRPEGESGSINSRQIPNAIPLSFVRIHKPLKTTLAMAAGFTRSLAGVTSRLCEIDDIVNVLEAWEAWEAWEAREAREASEARK
jgi:hypothetical protein